MEPKVTADHPEDYTVDYGYDNSYPFFHIEGATVSGNVEEGYSAHSILFTISLLKGAKRVDSVKMKVTIHRSLQADFETNDDLTYDGKNYNLSAKRGIPVKIAPYVEGFPEASFRFETMMGAAFSIAGGGILTVEPFARIGAKNYLQVYISVNGIEVGETYLDVTVVPSNPQYVLSLEENDERVKVSEVEEIYQIEVPYAGNYYPLPKVNVSGYQEEYDLSYVSIYEALEIVEINGVPYLHLLPGATSFAYPFEIDLLDGEGKVLTQLPCTAKSKEEGDKVFAATVDDGLPYYDGDTISLQQYLQFDFMATLNGRSVNPTKMEIVNENDEIASLSYYTLNAKKVGKTDLLLTYSPAEGEEYSLRLHLFVEDNSVLEALVIEGGEEAVSIYEGKVYVNGKLRVDTDIGHSFVVNGAEGLSTKIEDSESEGYKKVTFTYSERDQSVSATALAKVLSGDTPPKTVLTRHYDSYAINTATTPKEGDVKCLVIPIWFANSSDYINVSKVDAAGKNQKQQIREDLYEVIFGEDSASVASFYKEESFGKFNLSGTVSDWYTCAQNSYDLRVKTYGSEDEWAVATEAVNWYFATSGESFSDYDSDGDGVLDSLMLFYGTNGYGTSDEGVKDYYSRGFQAGGGKRNAPNTVSRMTWFSALDIYNIGSTSDPAVQLATDDLSTLVKELDTKTSIHEYGHTFGIADYYEENVGQDPLPRPAGGFSMQDSNLGGHEAFSVMSIGWADPYVYDASSYEVGETVTITISDFQSSHDCFLLTSKWDAEKEAFDEYLLLELYTPTGLNEKDAAYYSAYDANKMGLRVWHVDGLRSEELSFVYDNTSGRSSEDLLHLIRCDESATYDASDYKLGQMLFQAGDTFNMDAYKNQFFVSNGKLNNGSSLGWEFIVDFIGSDGEGNAKATITLTRVA